MYCERCGKYITDSDKGCTNCNNKKNNNDGIKWVIIIVGILFALFVLVNIVRLGISLVYLKNNYEDNLEKALTRVLYANQDIEAGTMITASMISNMEYMKSELPEGNYYLNPDDIVGKCTNYNVMIEKNSLFYKDMLVDCDELPEDFYDEDE